MPLTFDMPLEKLKAYEGRNPRPADFDQFWDAQLAEMRQIDPQIERVPSDFQTPFARCSDLYFTGVGGGLTLACAALEPRIKLAAPVFPFLCDYRRVWEMDLAKAAYVELRDYFRRFDPCHQREDEVFTQLGYIDAQHLAPRIRAEVFMAVGLMDEVCPATTTGSSSSCWACELS